MAHFYWCLTHNQVEQGKVCRAANRLGPYESAQAAQQWAERVEERSEAWKAEDERWKDPDPDEQNP